MPEVTEPYPKGAMDLHMDVHVRATQGVVAGGGSDLCSIQNLS